MKEKIMQNVIRGLDKAEIPTEFQRECFERFFNGNCYDMQLKADIMEHGARFIVKERGSVILDIYLDKADLIEYIMIRSVLESYFWRKYREQHHPPIGYDSAQKQYLHSTFEKLGETYLNYLENNVTVWNAE